MGYLWLNVRGRYLQERLLAQALHMAARRPTLLVLAEAQSRAGPEDPPFQDYARHVVLPAHGKTGAGLEVYVRTGTTTRASLLWGAEDANALLMEVLTPWGRHHVLAAHARRPALVPALQRRGSRLWREDQPPPPPTATLTDRLSSRPRLAPTTSQQPQPNVYTRGGCTREERGRGRGQRATPQGRESANSGGPRYPLPPTPLPGLRATGAPALRPPRGRGDVPPPPERTVTPGRGLQLDPHAARPRPHRRLFPRGSRQAGAPTPARKTNARATPGGGTREQTGAVWGPRPP